MISAVFFLMLVLNSELQTDHLHDEKPFIYFLCLSHMGKTYSQQQWINFASSVEVLILFIKKVAILYLGGRKWMFFK